MFDKFDTWKYCDNANCWDYVRSWLIEKAGVPESDVPKFGILPAEKKKMTTAHDIVKGKFVKCFRDQNAVACQYIGNVLIHVGVVDGCYVRHTGREKGTTKEKFTDFEKIKTVYFKYANS